MEKNDRSLPQDAKIKAFLGTDVKKRCTIESALAMIASKVPGIYPLVTKVSSITGIAEKEIWKVINDSDKLWER